MGAWREVGKPKRHGAVPAAGGLRPKRLQLAVLADHERVGLPAGADPLRRRQVGARGHEPRRSHQGRACPAAPAHDGEHPKAAVAGDDQDVGLRCRRAEPLRGGEGGVGFEQRRAGDKGLGELVLRPLR